MAVGIGALAGLLLGIVAALNHRTIIDNLCTIISVLGVSVPSYVFALALSYALGFKLTWLPMLYSMKDPFVSSIMPSIALCMFTLASIARFTRNEMLEVLGSDYMLLAESKGISGAPLIMRHALRNALIPIITVLAPLIMDLMTGSLVVEKIFSIPGVGSLLVTAIQSNDYNVVIALSFIYSAMYIGIMLAVDIPYGIIDPRIRLAANSGDAGSSGRPGLWDQLSGGMRQRVVIAIALTCDPDLLICDEPTTALDVTIQAKIVELIQRVQQERGISVIYITHDLGMVAKIADYVNVMYAGRIVEKGTVDEIFYDPRHPYTWGAASAGGYCAGTDHKPEASDCRRMHQCPGRIHTGPGGKSNERFAGPDRYYLSVYCP